MLKHRVELDIDPLLIKIDNEEAGDVEENEEAGDVEDTVKVSMLPVKWSEENE